MAMRLTSIILDYRMKKIKLCFSSSTILYHPRNLTNHAILKIL
jgi:hypothetical protein